MKLPTHQTHHRLFIQLIIYIVILNSCSSNTYDESQQFINWDTYHGDVTASHYSALDQINKENAHQLELAWIYRSGDFDERSQIQNNPIIVNGILFTTSPLLRVIALDAATGKEIWSFDPFSESSGSGVNRGLTYHKDRLLFTAGEWLYAIDAETGQLISSFGDGGRVSLKEGLDRDLTDLEVIATSPGIIYEDLLILGSRVSEGKVAAPGHIRSFDVNTGEQKWIFHTIPHPGEFGYETWPKEAYQTVGGANAWAGLSLDPQSGIVYVPTGSPSFDFHGGNRHGDNLFGNSLIALNAKTGERVWHFQTINHDLWDRDLPAQANLLTVNHEGKRIDAVAQVTKHGLIFLFDRKTGEPLFEIEERPVPPSQLVNEQTAKSQPYPVKPPPFSRQTFSEELISEVLPDSKASVLEKIKGANYGHKFTPPSTNGTVIYPGFDGGADWGGAAVDPDSGMLYVNASEMAWLHTMVPLEQTTEIDALGRTTYMQYCMACHGADLSGQQHVFPSLVNLGERVSRSESLELIKNGKGRMPGFQQIPENELTALLDFIYEDKHSNSSNSSQVNTDDPIPYTFTGYRKLLDANGYPAVKPPWGTLNAIDLNKGEIKWQISFGTYPELIDQGIPATGSESYGGPVSTAGGLLFIAGTPDKRFKIYDKHTGTLLWEYELPFAGYATPATYMIDGKQYVVIAAGGGKLGSESGDAYLAFALPDNVLN